MIRNGLYAAQTKALDGFEGGEIGVVVLRDGTIRGGSSFFMPLAPTVVPMVIGRVK